MPTHSHTHLQFTQANAQTKNCKRVCLANAQEKKKIVANLKDKRLEKNECQCLTKNIVHLAGSAKNEDISNK